MISKLRPISISGSSASVSPITLKDQGFLGALIEYQRFDFHLSLCLRAAALAFAPFAMTTTSYFGGYPARKPCDLPLLFEAKPREKMWLLLRAFKI